MGNIDDYDYENFTQRLAEREMFISQRINNISDPLEAIKVIIETEGSTLVTIWESDSGYPIDGVMALIVMIPVVLGIIGHYVASYWEPKPTGEELYDDFGNRIVEFPKVPIAYLQQTRKDLSATRENRNSLAWLCHKWLIATNDVVQELQAPYPLERSTLRTVPEENKRGKRIAQMYENLQKAALEWKIKHKQLKKDDLRRQLELRKKVKPLHTRPFKLVFRKAPALDIKYLKRRVPKAKVLWKKLNSWMDEYLKRPAIKKFHASDLNDSYWSSSETFSSDSGEHWKSYKGDTRNWARKYRTTNQWKLEKGRILLMAWLAEDARRRKAAEEQILLQKAAEEQKEKESRGSHSSEHKFITQYQNMEGEFEFDKMTPHSSEKGSSSTKDKRSSEKLLKKKLTGGPKPSLSKPATDTKTSISKPPVGHKTSEFKKKH